MNRNLIYIMLGCWLFAQSLAASAQQQYAYRISFTDKKGAAGDISLPAAFLSGRALSRRALQHIPVDSADLPVSNLYLDSVRTLTGGILHVRSRWLNNCVVLVSDTSAIAPLRGRSFVKDITYVAFFGTPLHTMPAPPPFVSPDIVDPAQNKHQQFNTMKTTGSEIDYYGNAYDQIALANGYYLHNNGFRGKGKMIAVLDAGFYAVNTLAGFDSMRSVGGIADTYNFDFATTNVYGYSSHGMEVLSTMAGIISGSFVGTAPDATYALYLTEDNGSEQPFEMDNLVAGLERADSIGADIATISLGYDYFTIGSLNADLSFADIDGKSTVAARGANMATAKGMLVVASAGNDGSGSWQKILTPGDADSALTIGSVDGGRGHVYNSGKGPNAAGVLKPDVSMLGSPSAVLNTSGTTGTASGTSLATPELAGLAACLWQMFPRATPAQLRDVIRRSAHLAARPDTLSGYGVPDFGKAAGLLQEIVDTTTIPADTAGFAIGPNPFNGSFHLTISAPATGIAELSLVDITGKLLLHQELALTAGTNQVNIDLPGNSPAGIYILRVLTGGQMKVIKLLNRRS